MEPRHEIPLKPRPDPKQLRAYDDRDGRKELLCLLNRLSPNARVEYMAWVFAQIRKPGENVTIGQSSAIKALALEAYRNDAADTRLTLECLFDLWGLVTHWSIDLNACTAELVRRAKKA